MRSVHVTAFGGPEVLEVRDSPRPTPGPGEAVIEVEAAEILFLDTQLRSGWGRDFFTVEPPFIPGVGIAGTVTETGDGVKDNWKGARVVTSTSAVGSYRGGGYAEFAAASIDRALRIPAGIDSAEALAVLNDGAMGVSRVDRSGLSPGDRALITAASGGIGIWLVPLLTAAGVHVTAAARGRQKVDLARGRGATVAVDYGQPGWADELGQVDVVFDGAGGHLGEQAASLLRRGGRFFSYGAASGDMADIEVLAAERDLRVIGLDEEFTDEDAHRYAGEALQHLATGSVRPVIGQKRPLERAAEAHAAIEARRVVGKSVLIP
ncbi:zinc-binding dehydrogenase [Pseudactinotalea sp. Z1748]|uniref:zinc-binding dehydrogenase n=1 Tax=Pseudactinotalea sp. Z1748 TaxID=3413027 RepID=UPI003C7D3C17